MGRLIDADIVKKRFPIMENDFGMVVNERLHKELDKIPTVEAISKADYEARLKAAMVAMLEDLKLDIEYCVDAGEALQPFEDGVNTARNQVLAMIDERINGLRG